MRTRKTVPAVLALVASAGIFALGAAAPAQAGGDTPRHLGCGAHWRNTATWGECQNSPGVELQFQAYCNWFGGFTGPWRYVRGSLDPVDRFDCHISADYALNAYRY